MLTISELYLAKKVIYSLAMLCTSVTLPYDMLISWILPWEIYRTNRSKVKGGDESVCMTTVSLLGIQCIPVVSTRGQSTISSQGLPQCYISRHERI